MVSRGNESLVLVAGDPSGNGRVIFRAVRNPEPMANLRAATPDDALEVARVHVRSWQVGYRGLLPQGYLDGLGPEDRAARYTFGDSGTERPLTIVAVEQGRICGFATAGRSRDSDVRDAYELMAIYVDPDQWGSGIGRLLIDDARGRFSRAGANEAVLWVMAANERARRFYRADGWAWDGSRRMEEIWGVTADEATAQTEAWSRRRARTPSSLRRPRESSRGQLSPPAGPGGIRLLLGRKCREALRADCRTVDLTVGLGCGTIV